MCSGSEAGSYLRLIDFVYHSTLGLRVIKKKQKRLSHQSTLMTHGTLSSRVEGVLDLFRHVDLDADHVPCPVPSKAALPNVDISEP